jgi:ubiquinone/menaquinone biosynthesis C-methylase UbiE
MSHSNDTTFVKQQYATSANLDARITLHQKFSTAPEHFHDWLFDHVRLPENSRVLEIGCGSGALWEHVIERVPSDWNITLTDFSFGMASTVQQKFLDPHFLFLNCDAQSLPFPNETFDGIFANHMLYHIPDLDRALGEIRRVLKPGGNFYAATNGIPHLRELNELVSKVTQQPMVTETPERIFGLENGASLLSRHFESVTRDVQENNLRVTEVEPLIAYVQSGWLFRHSVENSALEQEFRSRVQNEIDTNGAFFITKAVGLFIAN